jgi:leader peptidase (prepilin peptidase) / N-methyltransferase
MLVSGLTRPMPHPLQIGAAAIGIAASLVAAPSLSGVFGGGLALLIVAIASCDARSFRIPNELNLAAFALALVRAAVLAPEDAISAVGTALIRGAVLAFVFFALRTAYRQIRGREGIGLGDVKLAAVAGAWLDWLAMPVAIEIAALAALLGYMARQHIMGRAAQQTDRLPFGLFFAPAIWLGWIIETAQLMP